MGNEEMKLSVQMAPLTVMIHHHMHTDLYFQFVSMSIGLGVHGSLKTK